VISRSETRWQTQTIIRTFSQFIDVCILNEM
jgi:hypothetical protein